MHGPSTAVACALWLACVTPLLVADAAAPVARRHDRRARPGSTVTAADGYAAGEPAANAAAGDDYDAYDEEYEDSGDSRKRPPPPPPPPPPPTTTPSDRRTILPSYYIIIMCIVLDREVQGLIKESVASGPGLIWRPYHRRNSFRAGQK